MAVYKVNVTCTMFDFYFVFVSLAYEITVVCVYASLNLLTNWQVYTQFCSDVMLLKITQPCTFL